MISARSYLFVPADRPERYAKALASGADAVIVDLEDAVAPANKDAARAALAHWLNDPQPQPQPEPQVPVVVRVNSAGTPWFTADRALVSASPRVSAVLLPKADAASPLDS